MDLDRVKAGCVSPLGSRPPGSDRSVYLPRRELDRERPAIVKGQRAGRNGRQQPAPLVRTPGLAPGVGQLYGDGGSLSLDQADDASQRFLSVRHATGPGRPG